jgi:hypothetical protein
MRYQVVVESRPNGRTTVWGTFTGEWDWNTMFAFADAYILPRAPLAATTEYVISYLDVHTDDLPHILPLRHAHRYSAALDTLAIFITRNAALRTMLTVYMRLHPDIAAHIVMVGSEDEARARLAAFDRSLQQTASSG